MPEMSEFPDEVGIIPDADVLVIANGVGLLTSQNGEDLFGINLDIFVGPTPQDGAIRVQTDAKGAREIAAHLIKLADYAEIGVESPRE